MRTTLTLTLLLSSLFSACVLDSGVPPSERVYPPPDVSVTQGDDASETDEADVADGDLGGDSVEGIGPEGGFPSRSGVWPTSYTTTLQGGGWTLTPLGSHQGVTGTLSAPDGSLHLEALP